jgi:hypothetical protein
MGAWLGSTSKNVTKSERTLLDSSSAEKDRYISARAISIHDIGTNGTSTGITNSIHKNERTTNQADVLVDSSPSIQFSSTKTTNGKKEGRNIMQREQQSGSSLAETQFYARTSHTPTTTKRHELIYQKSDDIYSTPPIEDTFHDAIDDLNTNKDQIIDDKNMPTKIYSDWSSPYENEYMQTQELFITEATDVNLPAKTLLEKEKPINPFERLRPLEIETQRTTTTMTPPLVRPLKSSLERMHHDFDDNNDSSTSTTNRSIHLPIEKQRGLSEIVRKRNSRSKVEDYKRSFQKSNTFDERQSDYYRPLSNSKSDYTLPNNQISPSNISPKPSKRLNKTKTIDISIEYDKPTDISNENNETNEKMTVAAKKNLFETFNKDIQFGRGLTRSKSFKQESSSSFSNEIKSPSLTKISNNVEPEHHQTEVFHDDTSKLTFKEKMTLFNKKKNSGLNTSSTLKTSRNRLTQPITAEEVQAAENLSAEPSPTSSTKQLSTIPLVYDKYFMHDHSSSNESFLPTRSILQTSNFQENCFDEEHVKHLSLHNIDDTNMLSPEEAENMIPVSKRLEQLKTHGENEWKKRVKSINDANEFTVEGKLRQAGKISTPTDEQKSLPTSTRKTPTLKYCAKKTNTDQEQRAKTVDVIRLKSG